MNRSLSTSMAFLLAIAISALVGACDGGGPRCEPIVTPTTCDPVCDFAGGEVCNEDTDECVAAVACDPPACTPGETFCNSVTGACVAIPETCDPVCGSDEICDGTTCRAAPVCEPDCEADEFCTDE